MNLPKTYTKIEVLTSKIEERLIIDGQERVLLTFANSVKMRRDEF